MEVLSQIPMTKICHDANFVVTGGSVCSRNDWCTSMQKLSSWQLYVFNGHICPFLWDFMPTVQTWGLFLIIPEICFCDVNLCIKRSSSHTMFSPASGLTLRAFSIWGQVLAILFTVWNSFTGVCRPWSRSLTWDSGRGGNSFANLEF